MPIVWFAGGGGTAAHKSWVSILKKDKAEIIKINLLIKISPKAPS
jgi:hypothetical protein